MVISTTSAQEKEVYKASLNLYKDRQFTEALSQLSTIALWDTLIYESVMLECYCLLKNNKLYNLTNTYMQVLRSDIMLKDIDKFYGDIKNILPEKKRLELNKLSELELRDALIAFWVARDPDPFTMENEYLGEFFRRLEYVQQHYQVNEKIGYDDRGRMYLKHGEPTDKVILPGGFSDSVPNESWQYITPNGQYIYHFIDKHMTGRYYLEEDLGLARRHGTSTRLLEERSHLDPIYSRIVRSLEAESSMVTFDLQREVLERIEDMTVAESTEESFTPPKLVSIKSSQHFYFDLFQYKSQQTPSKTDMNIIIAFPTEKADFFKSEGEYESRIEIGAIFYDDSWREIVRYDKIKPFHASSPPEESKYLLQGFWMTLPPGQYHFALKAIAAGSVRGQIYRMGLDVDSLSVNRLALSDIQIGLKLENTLEDIARKRVPLVVNIFRQFMRTKPIQVYFEIYNLIYDIDEKTHYTVQYFVNTLETSRTANQQTVFLKQEFVGESRFEPVTLAIDINKLPTGKTRLTIVVEDLTVNETKEKYFDFLIIE
jgi:GWxTD domain-containing protein